MNPVAWVKSHISWAVCGCFWIFPTDAPVICPSPTLPPTLSFRPCGLLADLSCVPWRCSVRGSPGCTPWHPGTSGQTGRRFAGSCVFHTVFPFLVGCLTSLCVSSGAAQLASSSVAGRGSLVHFSPVSSEPCAQNPAQPGLGCSPRSACSRLPRPSASAQGGTAPPPVTARVLG